MVERQLPFIKRLVFESRFLRSARIIVVLGGKAKARPPQRDSPDKKKAASIRLRQPLVFKSSS